MKKSVTALLLVGLVFAILTGLAYIQPRRASAELMNSQGKLIGNADFVQQSDGVRIVVSVKGLSPATHGIHIHAVGMCSPPNFTSAAGHFNPEAKKHGLKNPEGPHAGDLPNLEVGPDGTGMLEYVNSRVTLATGVSNSLLKVNGTSLVIHAGADDEMTDPAGNSGARIACGAILAAGPVLGPLPAWLLAVVAVVLLVSGLALLRSAGKRSSTR